MADGSSSEVTFEDSIALFKDFIDHNHETSDKESSQQLFSCQLDQEGTHGNFKYLVFSVFSGYYGYASELVDRNTKQTVHKKTREQADVKRFYIMVVVPTDTSIAKASRGLIFFQEIGVWGVKTITESTIQEYLANNYRVTFRVKNLAPDFYLKKLFDSGILQRIKLSRSCASQDSSDYLYGSGFGSEERYLVPLKVTNALKRKLMHVSESDINYFSFNGINYSDVRMIVKIGDRTRTVNLHGLEDLSVEEALPSELLLADGSIAFDEYVEHMMLVSKEYLEHLPTNV